MTENNEPFGSNGEQNMPNFNQYANNNGFSNNSAQQLFNYSLYNVSAKDSKKRKYKKSALVIGIPFIIALAISVSWSYLYLYLAQKSGFSVNDAIDFANHPIIQQILQIVLSALMFTVPFAISAKISGRRISDTVPLSKPEKGTVFPYFMLGISVCFFSSVATAYAGAIFESFGIKYSVDFGENPTGLFGIALVVISTCIVPALVEEFAFRGIAMGVLLPLGKSFALFSSAVLFGVMHGNFEQIPFAILVGIILGFIRIKTGSLWVGIAVHFMNNLISTVFSYLSGIVPNTTLNLIYSAVVVISLILFFPALHICEKGKEKSDFSFDEKKDSEITEGEKYKWFFLHPVIITPLVFYFLKSFKYFI